MTSTLPSWTGAPARRARRHTFTTSKTRSDSHAPSWNAPRTFYLWRKVQNDSRATWDWSSWRNDYFVSAGGAAPGLDDAGERPTGTVGAVALDADGNLAAATSTGGIRERRAGRVGDTPIIGAGTYADNAVGAISGTGQGEYFLRAVLAHDIAARVEHGGQTLAEAVRAAVRQKLTGRGGLGGVIALDPHGRPTMAFNTPTMARGQALGADGKREVALFAGEVL